MQKPAKKPLNEWPENDAMKTRFQSGDTTDPTSSTNSHDSKAALKKMEDISESPHHTAVKDRLAAGTADKPVETPAEPKSKALKLLESREIGEWPENDSLKEQNAANKAAPVESVAPVVNPVEPIEWPANDAVKERFD